MITRSGFVLVRKKKNLNCAKSLWTLSLENWNKGTRVIPSPMGIFFEANPTIITLYLEFMERVCANFSYILVSETGLRMDAMTIDFCTMRQVSF
jgi:hypothetical protein